MCLPGTVFGVGTGWHVEIVVPAVSEGGGTCTRLNGAKTMCRACGGRSLLGDFRPSVLRFRILPVWKLFASNRHTFSVRVG